MILQEVLIQEGTKIYKPISEYKHYSSFNYDDLWSSHNTDEEYFISRKGLTFKNYVGYQYLTGNELLYYPELAQEMRKLKEYPVITRNFEVDKEITGLAFVEYFCKHVRECSEIFKKDLLHASQIVNHLIHLYGTRRYVPIIDEVIVNKINDRYSEKKLVVNGVIWELKSSQSSYEKEIKVTDNLDLYRLFAIPHSNWRVTLEDVVIGTPFIAVRIGKTWSHKGHVCWYNLDTLAQVSKADRVKWKRS